MANKLLNVFYLMFRQTQLKNDKVISWLFPEYLAPILWFLRNSHIFTNSQKNPVSLISGFYNRWFKWTNNLCILFLNICECFKFNIFSPLNLSCMHEIISTWLQQLIYPVTLRWMLGMELSHPQLTLLCQKLHHNQNDTAQHPSVSMKTMNGHFKLNFSYVLFLY